LQNKYNNKYNISFIGETVTELLSKKEKQRILKTLETDEEFRYAIELIEREYQAEPDKLRPRNVIIGHTGYIIYARAPYYKGV